MTGCRNGFDEMFFRIGDTCPCHGKAAVFDNNPADLVQEFSFVMNTDDCLVGRGKCRIEPVEDADLYNGMAVFNCCLDFVNQLGKLRIRCPSFLEIKVCTVFKCFHRDLFPAPPGKHDERDMLVSCPDLF